MELKSALPKVAFVLGVVGLLNVVSAVNSGTAPPISFLIPLLLLIPYPMIRLSKRFETSEDEIDHIPWE